MIKKNIDSKIAEESLISSLIYKPDKIVEVIDVINPNIFSVKEFSDIYKCIVELYKNDVIPDEVMIVNKACALGYDIAPELVKKLSNSRTFVTKKQLKQYCNIIKTSAFKRKTLDLCDGFIDKAKDINEPEKIINEFFSLAIDLSDKIKAENHTSKIDIDKKNLLLNIENRYDNPNMITGLKLGFPTIDKYIDGICNGKIYSWCGHNGHCKSLIAQQSTINMALDLLKNKSEEKILFFSLEMTREQMEERFLSIITGISGKYFKNPKLYFIDNNISDTKENFEQFKSNISNAVDFLNKLPIIINDASSTSAIEITAQVKKHVLKGGVACVFVDYAGLVMNDDCAEEYQNIGKTYNILKQTAKDTQVPFIILNQYMKSFQPNVKNGNRGTLFDIYGGKQVLNASHVILHINFPQKCREYIEEHPELLGKVIVYCDKNRDAIYGEMPDVICSFDNGRLIEFNELRQKLQDSVDKTFVGIENV